MRDLFEAGYSPHDVYVATGGYGTKGLQRDWVLRGLINTPIPEPRAGKGRNYPFLAVIEAALMAEAARSGISVSTISAAFHKRLFSEAKNALIDDKIEKQGGRFTKEDIQIISNRLSEFDDQNVFDDNAKQYGWMIVYEWLDAKPQSGGKETSDISQRLRDVHLIEDQSEIQGLLLSPTTVIIGVSATIRMVLLRQQAYQSGETAY